MFAREGYGIIAAAGLLAIVLVFIGLQMPFIGMVLASILALLIFSFVLFFFRDPLRIPPDVASEGNLLLAPADGKVVVVTDVEDPIYLKGPARQVSIFLSPLNVHVNRVPADGKIEYVNYVPGDYLVAWHPKASEKNERSEIGMRHHSGAKILFKQIAGAVARRIVYHLKEGDEVRAGDRFGIVKFGSRMDVLVPPHVVIDVKVGDRVSAGHTVLGHIPTAAPGDTESAASPSSQEVRE